MQDQKPSRSQRNKALGLTILAGFLWGTSFPAIKIGLQYMDAFSFVFLRFLAASLIMLAVLLGAKKLDLRFPNKRLVLFLGTINGVAYLLQYVGMVYTSAAKSSLLVNLSIIWVAILSPFLLKEHLNNKRVAGVSIGLLGVFMMTTNLDFASLGQGTIIGDCLVMGSGIAWAFFILYNKPLATDSNNLIQSMTFLLLFTLMPLLMVFSFSASSISGLGINAWAIILYTAILCWIVPYYLWLKGLKHLSPVTSAVVLLTEIAVAVTLATVILGEIFTVVSGIGGILIVMAILLAS